MLLSYYWEYKGVFEILINGMRKKHTAILCMVQTGDNRECGEFSIIEAFVRNTTER